MRTGDLFDGRYELLEPLRDDVTGRAWRARDTRQRGVEVTVVCAPPGHGGRGALRMRQVTELRDEAILAAIRQGSVGGCAYAVYELFDAPSLATLLAQGGRDGAPLPTKVVARIADRLCDALEAAHAQTPPLVHGALSTRNVRVQTAPKVLVRVAEFALSGDDEGGVRGDLIALGAVLRAMFAAAEGAGLPPPLHGRDWRRDDLPDALWAVALDACAGQFVSVEALRGALERAWRSPVTGPAPRPSAPPEVAVLEPAPAPTDDPHAATEVTFRRQETVAQEAVAPSPPPIVSEETHRSFKPGAAPVAPEAPPRDATATIDLGWSPPEAEARANDATSRSLRAPQGLAAGVDDATERRRVEAPARVHHAVVPDTVAVTDVGLSSPRANTALPAEAEGPTRLGVSLPRELPRAVGTSRPPPAAPPPPTLDEGSGRSRTWALAAAFVALFVVVAALVALR